MSENAPELTKNVFKAKDKDDLMKKYNDKWVELITLLEKSKGVSASAKQ